MINVLNISHNNFDGYTSSFLLREILHYEHKEGLKFSQFNVEYSDIEKTVERMVNFKDGEVDHLYITDLNMNMDSFNTLLKLHKKIKMITYINHNKSNKIDINAVSVRFNGHGVKFNVLAKQGLSTAKIIYETFKPETHQYESRMYALYKYKTMVEYVNSWDVHLFNDYLNFGRGQLFNDFFMELMTIFNHVPKEFRITMINIYFKYINNSVFLSNEISLTTIDNIVRSRLPREFMDLFWDDRSRLDITGRVSSQVLLLGFKQAISLIVAYVLTINPFNQTEVTLDNGEVVRLFYPEKLDLPMSVVHHLMYTLNHTDVAVIQYSSNKVEMRQAAERATVALNNVAVAFGGGGGVSAAGFYLNDITKDEIIEKIKYFHL